MNESIEMGSQIDEPDDQKQEDAELLVLNAHLGSFR